LTPNQELTALIDGLYSQCWEPAGLKEACDRIRLSPYVSVREFRHSNAMKPVREATVAAIFARSRPWGLDWKVRIVPQVKVFPDFKLCHDRDERLFEVVEARYPPLAKGNVHFEGWRHEDPDEGFRAGLREVAERIRQKAGRRYNPQPHLIVYCNFYGGTMPVEEVRTSIGDPHRDRFQSIWLLWDGAVKQL
jgi:hypothetical protein